MKTKMKPKILSELFFLTVLVFASCKKESDKQIPPVLNFKTDAGYTFTDATVPKNDTLKVGFTAQKSEEKDLLTRFVATQQYDTGAATTIVNESFNSDSYSKDLTIITRNIAGTEVYTFTIINRDGITTTKKLTLTVN